MQDNEIDMLQGISLMDTIYNGAVLTIVAAAGPNANVGLPGVRYGTRRLVQPVEEVKEGVEMTIVNSLDDLLDISHYSKRAWTFQEQLFSQRIVVFAPNGGVYFRCLRAVWSADTQDDEHPHILNYRPDDLYMALSAQYNPALAFDSILRHLTKRSLSDQHDALSAMGGLQHHLSQRMKCSFLSGLPTAAFDFYLLFGGHFVTLERRDCFPSWSWAGWMGCVIWYMRDCLMQSALLVEWLEKRTWIVWYQTEGTQKPQPVWDPQDKLSSMITDQDVCYRVRSSFNNRHVPRVDTSQTAPTESLELPSFMPSRPLLQFWTLSVHLIISRIMYADEGREVRQGGTIVDCNDEFCGSVRLDGYFFTENDTNKPVEFIILSECKDSMAGSEFHERYGIFGRREHDPERKHDPDHWDWYWVMLIRRDDDGVIAERRGLGQIYQDAVGKSMEPGVGWKEVLLR